MSLNLPITVEKSGEIRRQNEGMHQSAPTHLKPDKLKPRMAIQVKLPDGGFDH